MGKRNLTIVGLGLIALVLVGGTVIIPAMSRSAQKIEFDTLVTRPLTSVRDGATRVSITDTRLLHALAGDQECIENLKEITFSSVTLDDRDQTALERLQNVTTIGFYCCRNVDSIIPTIRALPLALLWFEIADITPEALNTIRDAKLIREIGFEQNLSEAQVRVLQSFPASIKITSSFPLDAYD